MIAIDWVDFDLLVFYFGFFLFLGFVDLAGEFGLEAVEFFAVVLFLDVVVFAGVLHESWFAWFGVGGEYL